MEPTSITAGTTAEWTRDDEYAYGLWTFTYTLTGPQQITIDTTADGGEVSVSVTAADTGSWAAGKYQWFLQRSNGTEKYSVDSGWITVEVDPTSQTAAVDHKTHNEKMLAAIEARLESRAASDYEQYTIDGRSLARIPFEQLVKLRTHYRNLVAREARTQSGKKSARRVIYRMP